MKKSTEFRHQLVVYPMRNLLDFPLNSLFEILDLPLQTLMVTRSTKMVMELGLPLPISKNIKSAIPPQRTLLFHQQPVDLDPTRLTRRRSDASERPGGAVMKSACMTGDFAMQNVALQMGLNLVNMDGGGVKYVKTWVLRCHGCFKYTPPKPTNVDCKYYEKNGFEILSFVWWTDVIENKYIDKFKWRNSNSSKKEHAMDKSWNKGTLTSRTQLNIVLITKTSWNDCDAITINSTTNPPSRSKRIRPRARRKKETRTRISWIQIIYQHFSMEVGKLKDLDLVDEVQDELVVVEEEEQMRFEDGSAVHNSAWWIMVFYLFIYPVFVRFIREFGVGFTAGRKG